MKKSLSLIAYILITIICGTESRAACPLPRTAIDFNIEPKYEYNKSSNSYVYTYKVTNGSQSKLNVSWFQIEGSEAAEVLKLPSKWWSYKFEPKEGRQPSTISFSAIGANNTIKPSSQPHIFQIRSKLRPGITPYYAEGAPNFGEGSSSGELKAVTINGDEEAAPDCPGFYINSKTILEQMQTGLTIGPVPDTQVDVKLKMKVLKDNPPKNWNEEAENPEISSIDKGKVELLLYADNKFDISKVDLKSIQFGPAKASPKQAKIASMGEVNSWKSKPHGKNKLVWMEFNLADLQVRCDVDNALFLRAKAGDKDIVGAVKMKPVICTPKIWKQMGIERKWPQTPEAH